MKPHVEMPELAIYRLQSCELCGEPLIPGETLCGKCRDCRVISPLRQKVSREPRPRHGRPAPWSRLT